MDPTLIGCEGLDSISFPEHKEKLCVFVDKVMKLGSLNCYMSLSFTRSGFVSNKCWLYLNILKITSCRETHWHTKKIILAMVYTTRISESHTYTKKVHTTNVYSSNPVSPTSIARFYVQQKL
jgi:hypothetical protein